MPLHLTPLTDLFAAAGLTYLVAMRPPAIEHDPVLAGALATLVPGPSLDRLADYLGCDVRSADELVAASYGDTMLYAVRVAHDPARVTARFRGRLTSAPEITSEASNVTRVAGLVGKLPRAVADLDGSVVLFETGRSGPIKAALAFALGKLKRARPALAAEPLATLRKRIGDAPLLVFAPTPARTPWSQGAHGLLERATAVGLAAGPGEGGLALRGYALGTWDDPPTEALRRLEKTVTDVAASPLGRLTDLTHPVSPFAYSGDRDVIRFEAVVDPQKVAEGLYAATGAQLRDLFPAGPGG